jgi:hypothetical protein
VVTQGALGLEMILGRPLATAAACAGACRRGGGLGAQGGDALQLALDCGQLLGALVAVALGLLGVVAEHEPPGRIPAADLDLLDPQVVAHLLVAALPRQHLGHLGGVVAQPLPGDPVPTGAGEIGQVVVAGEAAVDHGDDPA